MQCCKIRQACGAGPFKVGDPVTVLSKGSEAYLLVEEVVLSKIAGKLFTKCTPYQIHNSNDKKLQSVQLYPI